MFSGTHLFLAVAETVLSMTISQDLMGSPASCTAVLSRHTGMCEDRSSDNINTFHSNSGRHVANQKEGRKIQSFQHYFW